MAIIFALKAQRQQSDRTVVREMQGLELRRSMGYLPSLLTDTEITILLQKLQFVSEFQSCRHIGRSSPPRAADPQVNQPVFESFEKYPTRRRQYTKLV